MSDLSDAATKSLAVIPRWPGDDLRRAVVEALAASFDSTPEYARAALAKELREALDALEAAVPAGAADDPLDRIRARRALRAV